MMAERLSDLPVIVQSAIVAQLPEPAMSRFIIALLAATLLAPPASAAVTGCFTRTYDTAHLGKHKGQDVTFMAFQIGLDPDLAEDRNTLMLRFRNKDTLYVNGFVCVNRSAATHCKIIDSGNGNSLGGSFLLTEKANSVLLTPETDLHLVQKDTTTPRLLDVQANAEHRVFKLNRFAAGRCPGF